MTASYFKYIYLDILLRSITVYFFFINYVSYRYSRKMCDNGNKMQQSKENRIEVLYKFEI